MEVPQTNIIIQNPDGSVEIGTQPQFIDKKIIHCYNCQLKIIFGEDAKLVKCPTCLKTNGVPSSQKQKFGQCSHCKLITAFQGGQTSLSCPSCNNMIHSH